MNKKITKKAVVEFLRNNGCKARSAGVNFIVNDNLEVVEAVVYMAHNQRVSVKIDDGEPVGIKSF